MTSSSSSCRPFNEQAEYAFRRVPVDAREELILEVVAAAYVLFVSLCRRGKTALVYPTPLAKFAIRHVREGRRIGSRCKSGTSRHRALARRRESRSSGSTGSIAGWRMA